MACVPRRISQAISKAKRGNTLVQQTALRLRGITDIAAPIVVTNSEQRFLVAEQLRQVGVASAAIVLEPVSRNTAAAIAVSALLVLRDSQESLLLVLPSDHVIADEPAFVKSAEAAAQIAKEGYLVTFGIPRQSRTLGTAISVRVRRSSTARRLSRSTHSSRNRMLPLPSVTS